MEGLGALGFWLGLGIFLGAGAIAGAIKERDREREKQTTLRALLERGGEGTSEILAYLRERDAAETKLARDMAGLNWLEGGGARTLAAAVVAFIIGAMTFIAGLTVAGRLIEVGGAPWYIGIPAMIGVWALGLLIAIVVFRVIRGRKKAPPSGA